MKKQLLSLTLIVALTLAACGSQGSVDETTAPNDTTESSTTPAETEFVYEYSKTFGGSDFRIHNLVDMYGMRSIINREETNGDAFNDIMYNRARLVEEKLGIKIVETNSWTCADDVYKVIMAGEDAYDIVYPEASSLYTLIKDGCLYELTSLDGG